MTDVTRPAVSVPHAAGRAPPVKLLDAFLAFDAALDWPLEDEDLDPAPQADPDAAVEPAPA